MEEYEYILLPDGTVRKVKKTPEGPYGGYFEASEHPSTVSAFLVEYKPSRFSLAKEYTESFTYTLRLDEVLDLKRMAVEINDREWWDELVSYEDYMIYNDITFIVLKYRDVPDDKDARILYGKYLCG